MKKYYLLFTAILFANTIGAQIINFPDADFKAVLLSATTSNQIASIATPTANASVTTFNKIDTNDDGDIEVSEALAIKWLMINNSSITDLTGLSAFGNLVALNFAGNNVSTVDLSNLTNLKF
ncbi:MAG TPA: hypothetical protein VGB43_07265 [Flavobacterium sp.]|jgi:Leucine-rich repeat (LRR) protein